MPIDDFAGLREHVGHKLSCVVYADGDDVRNVALECETCGAVLLDHDNPQSRVSPDARAGFLNHYACPTCHYEWSDAWSAVCDDKCPNCRQVVSPHDSEDLCPDVVRSDVCGALTAGRLRQLLRQATDDALVYFPSVMGAGDWNCAESAIIKSDDDVEHDELQREVPQGAVLILYG